MTRHTQRDLMIGLQGIAFALSVVALIDRQLSLAVVCVVVWGAALLCTPSRLPPRNERGQFSKRD